MIYKIRGKLVEKEPSVAIVDVGGVFLETHITTNTYQELSRVDSDVELLTHLVVREDGFTLYGFFSLEEKTLFLQLTGVSKIGPKLAIALLSAIEPLRLKSAIINNEIGLITATPGIGKKTAERIILELKDKLGPEIIYAPPTGKQKVFDDVISALTNLGYKKVESINAIKKVPEDMEDFEDILKYSLKIISKS